MMSYLHPGYLLLLKIATYQNRHPKQSVTHLCLNPYKIEGKVHCIILHNLGS